MRGFFFVSPVGTIGVQEGYSYPGVPRCLQSNNPWDVSTRNLGFPTGFRRMYLVFAPLSRFYPI